MKKSEKIEFFKKYGVRWKKRDRRLHKQSPITSTKLTYQELTMSKTNFSKQDVTTQQAQAIKDRYYSSGLTEEDKNILSLFETEQTENAEMLVIDDMMTFVYSHKTQQIDMWYDKGLMLEFKGNSSASPKMILRSPLFSAIGRGRRKGLTDLTIFKDDNIRISYTGVQLDQADHDIQLCAVKMLSIYQNTENVQMIKSNKGKIEYSRVFVDDKMFQKEVRGRVAGGTLKHIKESFARLGGKLVIEENGVPEEEWINGAIIGKTGYSKKNGKYFFDINHDFIKLFKDDEHQFINMDVRLGLSKGFAKWLYGFVLTFRGDAKYSAEKLYDMSGSRHKIMRKWISTQMIPSFKELEEKGIIKNIVYPKKGTHLIKWTR